MTRSSVLTSLALLLLGAVLLPSADAQAILAPSYINPYDAGWNAIIAAGGSKVPIALINPGNGPGTSGTDSWTLAYANLVKRAQAAGIKVFGYVHTSYGAVPVNTAITQIGQYYSWMGVNGIFIDEASTDCGLASSYYSQIYNNVRNRGGQVILNPGTVPNECYMAVGDIILSSETDWNYYLNNYGNSPAWVYKYAPSRFYHIAYSVPGTAMAQAVRLATQRNAGYVYFTEVGLPNPYAPLTVNWNALVSACPGIAPAPVAPVSVPSNVINNQAVTGNALGVAAPATVPTTAGAVWQSLRVSFSADGANLLLGFTSYTAFNLSGAPRSGWSRVNFFIDLDNNAATGFAVAGGVCGSEVLVQGTGIFRQAAGNFNAGAAGTAAASATLNTYACTLSVPVALLRSINAAMSTVRVVAYNDETGAYMPPQGMFVTAKL